MKQELTFGGVKLSNFGVWISGSGTFSGATRDVSKIQVPGRNGDLVIDNGRFNNVQVKYPAFVLTDARNNIDELRDYLSAHSVIYCKLSDTYHPSEYRLARYSGGFAPSMARDLRAGTFDLVFDCYPERFLLSGEEAVDFEKTGSIDNNTAFSSDPIVRVYGNGVVGIGSYNITIANSPFEYIDVDCDIMDCYSGASNANQYVTLTDYDFPKLLPGSNGVSLGAGIEKVSITPRWYRI